MASTKLSAEDRQAAVALYQEAGQTAATVAETYGVSVSTISRLLKNELPKETYDALVKQKRGGGEAKSKKRTTTRKKPVSRRKRSNTASREAAASGDEGQELVIAGLDDQADDIAATDEHAVEEKPKGRKRASRRARPVSRRRTRKKAEAASAEPIAEVVEETLVEPSTSEREMASAVEASAEGIARPKLKRETEDEGPSDEKRPRRRKRRRSSVSKASEETANAVLQPDPGSLSVVDQGDSELSDAAELPDDATEELQTQAQEVLEAMEEELDDELEGINDDDFDDAFDDDLDDEDASDNITSLRRRPSGEDVVQVLPLAEANLSRMLYLVIDRTADLITMPMQHFSDLGRLPVEEEEKRTLPVFENHRVARRFSQRNQRVIKVPDGQLLSKTASWLEAKGITRCLLDGQVYSLESFEQE